MPEVRTTRRKPGQPEDGTDPKTIASVEVFVDIKPEDQWRPGMTREKITAEMQRALSAIPVSTGVLAAHPRQRAGVHLADHGQIVIKLAGDDLAELKRLTDAIAREVRQVPGVARAEIDRGRCRSW